MNKQDNTNGSRQGGDDDMFVLEVFRVEPGSNVFIRTLQDGLLKGSIAGCYTHYYQKRSYYCPGPDCNPVRHKMDKFWKGYTPVEVFNRQTRKWRPFVLEVTQNLELDFRGIFHRGQLWELWRHPQTGRKKTPVGGKLQEELDPKKLPQPFDIMPPLKAMYNVAEILLDLKNPMPNRVILCESEGDAPQMLLNEPEKIMSAEEIHERLQHAMNGKTKTPSEQKHR